jgi:hypothetical protein
MGKVRSYMCFAEPAIGHIPVVNEMDNVINDINHYQDISIHKINVIYGTAYSC